jgi:hypothetical protein
MKKIIITLLLLAGINTNIFSQENNDGFSSRMDDATRNWTQNAPRRTTTETPPGEPNWGKSDPINDGLLICLTLAGGYFVFRFLRRRGERSR